MGIYDRDHRQNDPWKNNSKKETEFDRQQKIKLKEFKQIWKLEKPKSKSLVWFIPWVVGLLIILAIAKEFHKHNTTNPITPVSAQNIEQPIFKPSKALPILPTSILSASYDQASTTCPLSIIADNKNYYIKLCDMLRGGKTVAKFFVRAGEELKTTIPAGNYKIKFGSGDEWYGEEELFGQFSQYGESESLNFNYDGYTSQGHTISFYQQVNGNFHTNNIGRDSVLQD
ncbi:MAG: hypothetical protein AB7U44_02500 [Sulfuricurvum sp.]|uniref:hypothetical protein n=1 Tax=Sulfuricurvum sp. TaxID=2025608 RepID=UPI00356677E5